MVTPAYVLSLMLLAVPAAPPVTRATFDKTAGAIAESANASPLFAGTRGDEKTAALLVALGKFESSLDPAAEGDCADKTENGVCKKGGKPHSFCLLQVNESNFAYLRTSREELTADVHACVRAALVLLQDSFRICKRAPLEERLSWYAGGGGMCAASDDARKKSRHRMALARWLFDKAPPAPAALLSSDP